MNLKKILAVSAISLSMVAGVGAAIGVSAGANLKEAEVKAEEETTYYLCGRFDADYSNYDDLGNWDNTDTTYGVSTNANTPSVFNFKKWTSDSQKGDEFKFVLKDSWDGALGYSQLRGTAAGCFGNSGGNIYCNETGSYNVYISGELLYIDYAEFYLKGTVKDGGAYAGDWSHYTAKPLATNGAKQSFDFGIDEKFGISYSETYLGITACADAINEDDTYYSYFRCFSGTNDIVIKRADKYNVSLRRTGADLKINIEAYSVSNNTVYVLDLNGDLLSTTHKAHYWNGTQQTESPGQDMSLLDGTANIYEATYWDIFTNANFNNGTTFTVDETLTGNEGKCLVLGWDYSDGKWQSNTWVDLDAAKFIDKYMKFETKHETDKGSGDCVSSGWYDAAKTAYEAAGFAEHRAEVCKSALVVARLQKWAIANGKTFEVTDGVGAFSAARVTVSPLNSNSNTNFVLIASIAAGTVITAVGATFLLRRRKEDR